jgi:type I restriction enzyme S subunit
MKRYEKYIAIPSTVSPVMPEAWTAKKLKFILSYSKGKQPSQLTEEPIGDPYATMDYLRGRDCILQYPVSTEGLVHIDNDSLLVLWDGANAGEFLRGKAGYLGSTMAVIKAGDNMDKSYLFYLLKGSEALSKMIAGGTTIPHFSPTFFDEVFAIPSLDEQRKIAAFLDYKTGKIDRLAEILTARIDDLKKYRQTIISDAVKHGVNNIIDMRPVHTEWIGELPERVELTRLKYVTCKIGSGVTPTGGASVYQDSGVLFIRSQNVYPDGLRLDDAAYISHDIDEKMQNTRVQHGDVLLNITGASIGRCSTYDLVDTPANVNQHVCIIRPIPELANSKYIQYVLNSSIGQTQINLFQTGGSREGLNFEQLRNFAIPNFTVDEQSAIAEYLDQKTKQIDETIAATEQQIKDVQAYRMSLIYEAVTGQIDVRDWTIPVE